MRSKNWCCKLSFPLVRKDLTRFWPVWATYFVIWALILPISMINTGIDLNVDAGDLNRLIVNAGESPAVIMSLLFGGFSAFAVWSYRYRQNSASLFHALPVTRETHFLSHFLAGLSFLWVPNCLIVLLSYLCQLGLGVADPTLLLQWLVIVSLEGLLFYSIGTLAAMLTGNLVTMPVLSGLLNFAVVACESMLQEFSTSLYYGVRSLDARLTALSPAVHLLDNEPGLYMNQTVVEGEVISYVQSVQYFNPDFFPILGWYTLAAALISLAALLLYRRHATETAGDVIAVPALRPVAKYAFALGCALCLGWIFEEVLFVNTTTALTIFLSCALGGAIGYMAALMLLQKSFRVFQPRQLAGFLPLLIALALWVTGVDMDLFGVESHIPHPEDIETIELLADYEIELTQPWEFDQAIALHKATLAAGEPDPPDTDGRFRLDYHLRDGSKISRWYDMVSDPALMNTPGTPANLLAAIVNDPDRLVAHYLPPEDAILQSGQVYVFHGDRLRNDQHDPVFNKEHLLSVREAIEQDLRAGKTGTWQSDWRKDQDLQFRVELQCIVPLDDEENAKIWPTTAEDAQEGYRTRWFEVAYYADYADTAAYALLCKLGYLK